MSTQHCQHGLTLRARCLRCLVQIEAIEEEGRSKVIRSRVLRRVERNANRMQRLRLVRS
jgi:hypothetical protein